MSGVEARCHNAGHSTSPVVDPNTLREAGAASALILTHHGSDLLQERLVFTPVVLRHRLHCLPDLLHPGNHIVVQHLRSTHTDNSWDTWTWEEDAGGEEEKQ